MDIIAPFFWEYVVDYQNGCIAANWYYIVFFNSELDNIAPSLIAIIIMKLSIWKAWCN